jgi:hypothetical protein
VQVIDLAGETVALLAPQRRFRSKFPVFSLLPGNCPHRDQFGKTASTTIQSWQTDPISRAIKTLAIPVG